MFNNFLIDNFNKLQNEEENKLINNLFFIYSLWRKAKTLYVKNELKYLKEFFNFIKKRDKIRIKQDEIKDF